MKKIVTKEVFYNEILPNYNRLMLVGSYGDCYEILLNPTRSIIESVFHLHKKQSENNPLTHAGGFLCLYDNNATKAIRFHENCSGEIVIDTVSGKSIAKKECDYYM